MPNPSALSAQVLLAALLVAAVAAQIACVLEHCALALAECEADATCRTWSTQPPVRYGPVLPAAVRRLQYKPTNASSAKIDQFSECVISEHHCIPQVKEKCPLPAESALAKKFDLSASLDQAPGTSRCRLNPHFDCFDCQLHTFKYDPSVAPRNKPLHGDLKYNVKVNLNCTGSDNCTYLPREVFQSLARSACRGLPRNHNNSLAELHYSDDWYVLYASETAVLIYYCGCNDATCGYSGSVLYSRTPKLPSGPEQSKISPLLLRPRPSRALRLTGCALLTTGSASRKM